MAQGISDAIADLLARPVSRILGSPDDPQATETLETIVSWIVNVARAPTTREFVTERIAAEMARASQRTWGELLAGIPSERISGWVVRAARSEVAGTVYRQGGRLVAGTLFERPIGRPARLLPGDTTRRIQGALSDPLWNWFQAQIPAVVRKLDVARRVEEKILDFPVERMEELVRRVTDRELRTIIRLGYALGAFIGSVLVAVDYLLG